MFLIRNRGLAVVVALLTAVSLPRLLQHLL
jgi:hypothetical protein